MIAYLEGTILEKWEDACIILVGGGVGYEVRLPSHTWAELPERGGPMALHIGHVVREDAQDLYGFSTFEERRTFEILLSISRVGARTALAILSLFRPDDLHRLVLDDDALSLTRVPGIGKKTAQQIFLELKYRLKADGGPSVGGGTPRPASVFRDVLDGLGNLGYAEEECLPVVKDVLAKEPDLDVAGALRAALKALAAGRAR